jgi:protein TonB
MFEQSELRNQDGARRFLSTGVGVAAQCALVTFAILMPMLWPDALTRMPTWAAVSLPPPSRPAATPEVARRRFTPVHPFELRDTVLRIPRNIPARAVIIEDPPGDIVVGVAGAVGAGNGGVPGLAGILSGGVQPIPPPRAQPAPKPAPAAPPRVRLGGVVRMARLVHRVDPIYPRLAINARISGTVELEGVIGTDGRLRELRVLRGHLLLAPAALDAVRQWVYEPTYLNGEPVEVVAPISVTFKLGQ